MNPPPSVLVEEESCFILSSCVKIYVLSPIRNKGDSIEGLSSTVLTKLVGIFCDAVYSNWVRDNLPCLSGTNIYLRANRVIWCIMNRLGHFQIFVLWNLETLSLTISSYAQSARIPGLFISEIDFKGML